MISLRSQRITPKSKQRIYYSDFTRDFDLNPVTGSVELLTNSDSIRQSIENLVMTNKGERFYSPNVGSDVPRSLFELFDDLTGTKIQTYVTTVIQTYEPRASALVVNVTVDMANNNYVVDIQFTPINIPGLVQTMQIVINRVR